ncbi:MAG: class I SAM-dependent methyltransferase [Roseitalea sp.]|jgi:S-adenosylmethionine-diacylgycerolhomoserine-N-methlytransferase|nr:class I SAM-dependent methyltransferase [Roseitalea sp.]MBO6721699.1 class I SAM-dependent methyltransferase [Roseitalea sp.]MBO6743512.1 class I SAM-dependent methyltransferase [Roseitalea sp.]
MAEAADTHSGLMDAIYRKQRHIYDLTRKYYLLGRDRMIDDLNVPPGGTVLEVACGTGRNLIQAADRYRDARFHGFDISAEMLKSAQATVTRKGLGDRIRLTRGDATDFDPEALFGIARFDRVFISYSVSMIPVWKEAIARSATVLEPGGELHVVDFGEQTRLPRWFGAGLRRWLAKFHVTPRGDLEAVMQAVADRHGGRLQFVSLYRDYARYGRVTMPDAQP